MTITDAELDRLEALAKAAQARHIDHGCEATVIVCAKDVRQAVAALRTARAEKDAIVAKERLPQEPTREMWAAMGDAYGKVHRDNDRQPTLHHDEVTGAIYAAIRSRTTPPAAKPGPRPFGSNCMDRYKGLGCVLPRCQCPQPYEPPRRPEDALPVALAEGEELWILKRDQTGRMHGVSHLGPLYAVPPDTVAVVRLLADALKRAIQIADGVEIFVTSKERINEPTGRQWFYDETNALRAALANPRVTAITGGGEG